MKQRAKPRTTCGVERRVVVRHQTLNMSTGEMREAAPPSVRIGPCDVPLFTDDERDRGMCRSCRSDWSVEENRPTEHGCAQILEGRVS